MFWFRSKFGKKIGFRYLRSKKSSGFLSLITAISIIGVFIGVLTLIVTLSVMRGFDQDMKKNLFNADVHILVQNDKNYFDRDESLLSQLQTIDPKIKNVFPVLQTEVVVRCGKKVMGSIFKGVDSSQYKMMKSFVIEWGPIDEINKYKDTERIIIGQEMAFQLAVVAGEKVTIVSPLEMDGPFGSIPRMKQFVVEGIFKTNIPEQEYHNIFMPIQGVEDFLKVKHQLSQIEIRTDTMEDADRITKIIKNKIPQGFIARSWQELNQHLFHSLKLEYAVMFGVLFIIVIVATFNIASTLTMMVIEKKRSLSILRAMGATPKQISSIFFWEGTAIGLIGIVSGAVISLLICLALGKYQFVELPDFFYDRNLPVVVEPFAVISIIIGAFLIVILSSYIPSKKASQMTPLDGIRDVRS